MMPATPYVGRFAPSPSGSLHLGSLLTALTSYLDAKAHQGLWLVRIEDIDPPREQLNADRTIIDSLKAHGLISDKPILYQSTRLAHYHSVIERLLEQDQAYRCICTRAQIKATGGKYPGTCSTSKLTTTPSAVRYRNPCSITQFNDRFSGLITLSEHEFELEDITIQRKDGLFAYNLAVVLDDIEQGITHIVRGFDLLPTTIAQMNLWQYFSPQLPDYAHTPLLVSSPGQKLSKQNHASAIDNQHALDNVLLCLSLLNISISEASKQQGLSAVLQEAVACWQQGIHFPSHEIIVT